MAILSKGKTSFTSNAFISSTVNEFTFFKRMSSVMVIPKAPPINGASSFQFNSYGFCCPNKANGMRKKRNRNLFILFYFDLKFKCWVVHKVSHMYLGFLFYYYLFYCDLLTIFFYCNKIHATF